MAEGQTQSYTSANRAAVIDAIKQAEAVEQGLASLGCDLAAFAVRRCRLAAMDAVRHV